MIKWPIYRSSSSRRCRSRWMWACGVSRCLTPWCAAVFLMVLGFFSVMARARALPAGVSQVVVAVADNWDSSKGRLQCYEKGRGKGGWRPIFDQPVPVLYGKGGLAWGRGVMGPPEPGWRVKKEGDKRAPAGVFAIGRIYGYAPALPEGSSRDYPYRQVTRWDAWVDDVKNPHYNRHVVVDPQRVPPWFQSQKMRHGDFAYKWLIEIRHNSDPPVPGAGSAIFFHIRRGPERRSAGCTTMREADLVHLIRWLKPGAKPHYVLLPSREFARLRPVWGFPPPP